MADHKHDKRMNEQIMNVACVKDRNGKSLARFLFGQVRSVPAVHLPE